MILLQRYNKAMAGICLALVLVMSLTPIFAAGGRVLAAEDLAAGRADFIGAPFASGFGAMEYGNMIVVNSGISIADSADSNGGAYTGIHSNPYNLTTDDIYLMARLIHAEARGEPFTGQVAVGAVLVNRLKSGIFPDSIERIIFSSGEFCTVRDGQIYMTPDARAIRAARIAASGWDPTDGALYFYNPAKSTSRWIFTRDVITRIGNHLFAK